MQSPVPFTAREYICTAHRANFEWIEGEVQEWLASRAWDLPPTLVPLLVDARQALARLDGAGRYLPGNSILLRPLQQREALRSSALEGTFATAEELLAYGLEPKNPTSTSDPVNSWREVFNYDEALQRGLKMLTKLPLSSRIIRELHEKLLDRVRGTDRTPGVFR